MIYRFTTYQDARRVRLVNGLGSNIIFETNILRSVSYYPLLILIYDHIMSLISDQSNNLDIHDPTSTINL